MDLKQRIFLGAIGGITPYLVTLLSIDFKFAVGSYELLDWIGLAIRCLILVFLGALVAYLHKTETEPFKLFQLGLAAPALFATYINGNAGVNQALPTPEVVGVNTFSIVSVAYAADDVTYKNDGMLREPRVSAVSRLLRGVFGTKLQTSEKEIYFVIVGSHKNRDDAARQAEALLKKNYKAVVYSPYGASDYYAVVIASNVSREEAVSLRDRAVSDGLPKDSYVWSY